MPVEREQLPSGDSVRHSGRLVFTGEDNAPAVGKKRRGPYVMPIEREQFSSGFRLPHLDGVTAGENLLTVRGERH